MNGRMVYTLYNILWYIIFPIIVIRELLNQRPILKYIKPLSKRDIEKVKGKKVIWLHAVSVGETVVANTILRELIPGFPGYHFVFTTHTPTGAAMARKLLSDVATVTYFPLDLNVIMWGFIRLIQPKMYMFFETEIWPNAIRYCSEAGAKVIMINGRISDRSYTNYLKLEFFLRHILNLVDLFAMQSFVDAERIENIGACSKRIIVTGNVKFDQKYPEIKPEHIQLLKRQYGWEKMLIFAAASTHRGEEEIIIQAYKGIKKEGPFVLVLAPRHPERAPELEKVIRENGLTYVKRTKNLIDGSPEVLLLDTFGELSLIYAAADVVFVGGSLVKVGGHNVLEAAFQQRPVIYGPYMNNFRDSKILLERLGAGFVAHDKNELIKISKKLIGNRNYYKVRGIQAKKEIINNRGAAKKTVYLVTELMKQKTQTSALYLSSPVSSRF